jgi:hypothetical protein
LDHGDILLSTAQFYSEYDEARPSAKVCRWSGGGGWWREEVAQITYTHVSKSKNDKIKFLKIQKVFKGQVFHMTVVIMLVHTSINHNDMLHFLPISFIIYLVFS